MAGVDCDCLVCHVNLLGARRGCCIKLKSFRAILSSPDGVRRAVTTISYLEYNTFSSFPLNLFLYWLCYLWSDKVQALPQKYDHTLCKVVQRHRCRIQGTRRNPHHERSWGCSQRPRIFAWRFPILRCRSGWSRVID